MRKPKKNYVIDSFCIVIAGQHVRSSLSLSFLRFFHDNLGPHMTCIS